MSAMVDHTSEGDGMHLDKCLLELKYHNFYFCVRWPLALLITVLVYGVEPVAKLIMM